jgi:hypothetical protein
VSSLAQLVLALLPRVWGQANLPLASQRGRRLTHATSASGDSRSGPPTLRTPTRRTERSRPRCSHSSLVVSQLHVSCRYEPEVNPRHMGTTLAPAPAAPRCSLRALNWALASLSWRAEVVELDLRSPAGGDAGWPDRRAARRQRRGTQYDCAEAGAVSTTTRRCRRATTRRRSTPCRLGESTSSE